MTILSVLLGVLLVGGSLFGATKLENGNFHGDKQPTVVSVETAE